MAQDDDDSQVMGNVTLPYTTVERMRSGKRNAERELAAARARIAEMELTAITLDPGSVGHQLASGLRHALKIVQWAQGNYDPETVRGWPHEDLAAVALTMRKLPGVTQNELEWATDAIHYAGTADAVERARKVGRQQEIAQIPRSSMSDGSYKSAVEKMLTEPQVQRPLPALASAEPTAGPGAAALVEQVTAPKKPANGSGEEHVEQQADQAAPAEDDKPKA